MLNYLKILLLSTFLLTAPFISSSYAQNAYYSNTYDLGDILTDTAFVSKNDTSSCPGNLTVSIPPGSVIDSVDVEYDMIALGGGWKSEQRSELWCISPGGMREDTAWPGKGNLSGTESYHRTGLIIANGVTGGGDVYFQLHAGRTFGGSGCGGTFNKVVNGTWTITVYFKSPGLWLGYSTAWDDTGNWYGSAVPDINADVFIPKIPEGGNFPVISGTVTAVCDTIVIENGASLTIQNGGSLTSY